MRQPREGVYVGRQTIAAPDDVMSLGPDPDPAQARPAGAGDQGDTTLAALLRAVLEAHVARGCGME